MTKVINVDFKHKVDDDSEWILICPECDGESFEIRSSTNPETDEDWEVDFLVCSKCGYSFYFDD